MAVRSSSLMRALSEWVDVTSTTAVPLRVTVPSASVTAMSRVAIPSSTAVTTPVQTGSACTGVIAENRTRQLRSRACGIQSVRNRPR